MREYSFRYLTVKLCTFRQNNKTTLIIIIIRRRRRRRRRRRNCNWVVTRWQWLFYM